MFCRDYSTSVDRKLSYVTSDSVLRLKFEVTRFLESQRRSNLKLSSESGNTLVNLLSIEDSRVSSVIFSINSRINFVNLFELKS